MYYNKISVSLFPSSLSCVLNFVFIFCIYCLLINSCIILLSNVHAINIGQYSTNRISVNGHTGLSMNNANTIIANVPGVDHLEQFLKQY